jgi:prepilin-type N-terminal cleavage/methylation domain-containing protein
MDMNSGLQAKPKIASTRVGFTLVELLAVLAIVVVLVGVLAPALGGFGARGITTAANIVMANLHETRAIALGETTPTRLAISADVGDDKYMRGLTILKWQTEVDAATGGVTGSWVQAKPWTMLPDGVVIEHGKPAYIPDTGDIAYGDSWLGAGGEYFTDTATYLTEGMPGGELPEGETPPPYVFIEYKPSGYASVFLATGEKCSTRNIHLVLTDGSYNGSGVVARNQGATVKNWAHLVTDSVGGRIKNFRP